MAAGRIETSSPKAILFLGGNQSKSAVADGGLVQLLTFLLHEANNRNREKAIDGSPGLNALFALRRSNSF